ncbi:hypothetical protein MES4922_20203 [Mesorhizobium ventifaucium]|uniref:DUF1403 family protein n=1 Tax=Mesorhizobium ventifaucium TaxID=666020 RepID=A0ABN8JM20_9HYPH|nr:hypothetical protein MES4922_20203 [Mesorhizobium ventifaucium]
MPSAPWRFGDRGCREIASLTASAYRRLSGSAAFGAGAAVDHACPGAAATEILAGARDTCRDFVGIGLTKLLGFALQLASQPSGGLVDFKRLGARQAFAGLADGFIAPPVVCACRYLWFLSHCSTLLRWRSSQFLRFERLSAAEVPVGNRRRRARTEVATAKRIQAETARGRGGAQAGFPSMERRRFCASATTAAPTALSHRRSAAARPRWSCGCRLR